MYLDCKTIVIGQHLICLFEFKKNSTNSLFEFGKTVQIFFLGKKKKVHAFGCTCMYVDLKCMKFTFFT